MKGPGRGTRTGANRRTSTRPGGRDLAPPSRFRRRSRRQHGQAVVELALVLPLACGLLLVLIEAGLVARDQIMVVHAAREAARVAAVDPAPAAAVAAARSSGGLDDMTVELRGRAGVGSRVTATVRYREPGRIPVLGILTSHLVLEASATMRVEGDDP